MRTRCTNCKRTQIVADSLFGRAVACTNCGKEFNVETIPTRFPVLDMLVEGWLFVALFNAAAAWFSTASQAGGLGFVVAVAVAAVVSTRICAELVGLLLSIESHLSVQTEILEAAGRE